MIEEMYIACADILTLGTQLVTAEGLPAPDILKRKIDGLFDDLAERAREAHIADEDVAEARYALAAFLDEQIFRSNWPGRQQWMGEPLQLLYFNENTAGEGFFQHIDLLLNQPRRVHVLAIFYLCLTLGFQGRYAVRGGEGLGAMIEQVGGQISRYLTSSDPVSPHGLPRDPARSFVRREAPLVGLSLAFLGLALDVFIALKVILTTHTSDEVATINKIAVERPPPSTTAPARP